MLIGIYANPERDVGLVFARKLAGELEKAGAEYVVHDSVLGVFGKARGFGDDCKPRPDMIVSLGGDGTILSAIAFAAPEGIPVMGVNLGGMGFLTAVTADDNAAKETVRIIMSGNYTVSERAMLKARAAGRKFFAINEVVFYKRSLGKTVDVSVRVGDSHVANYKADGFIVGTPTGSTGWALSVGGPIVCPDIPCLLLLPMNCHQLSARPVIASDKQPVIVAGSEPGSIIADGNVVAGDAQEMTVVRAPFNAKLVTCDDFGFYGRLNRKLGLAK